MSSLESLEKKLKEPFPEKIVHFRVGSMSKDKTKGIALAKAIPFVLSFDIDPTLKCTIFSGNGSFSFFSNDSNELISLPPTQLMPQLLI